MSIILLFPKDRKKIANELRVSVMSVNKALRDEVHSDLAKRIRKMAKKMVYEEIEEETE
jgi:DNA-binding LacI/PurR family transcriptional regulator